MTLLVYFLIGALFMVNSILVGVVMHVGKEDLLAFAIGVIFNSLFWPIAQTITLIGVIIYCKRHVPPQKVDLVFIDDVDTTD